MSKNETANKLATGLNIFSGIAMVIIAIFAGISFGSKTDSFGIGVSIFLLTFMVETGIWAITSLLQGIYDTLIEINKKLPATATKEEQ